MNNEADWRLLVLAILLFGAVILMAWVDAPMDSKYDEMLRGK